MDEKNNENITINKNTLWQGLTVLFALLFVGSFFWNSGGSVTGAVVNDLPIVKEPTLPSQPTEPSRAKVSLEGAAAVKGADNAPVTVVEYSDYQCPFCERFFSQTGPSLMKDYVDSGKVKFVYKDLPLPFHPNAEKAAVAARCAGDQGNYWKMHDALFEKQNEWSSLPDASETFAGYAKELGLDDSKLKDCMKSGKFDKVIQQSIKEANTLGLSGTPSFVINGLTVVGAQPYSVFQQAIESELN
ncbi:DsbA family protein [Candidatus Woesearchaeota archaeon]|nr:DsbA family protein [Candidatus Woesearchaeota archaeon]